MSNDEVNDRNSLGHSGVKGMRWGQRKRPSAPASQDAAKAGKLESRAKKYGAKNLSNAEIKRLNERRQLERSVQSLNPGAIQKGQNAVALVLAAGATATAVYKLATSPMVRKGAQAAVKVFNKVDQAIPSSAAVNAAGILGKALSSV